MKKALFMTSLALLLIFCVPNVSYARSGCCSYHGGVCGCSCCDGTPLSSTCAPYYPECSQPVNILPATTKKPIIKTPTPSTPIPTVQPTETPEVKSIVSPTPSSEVKGEPTQKNHFFDWVVGIGIGIFALPKLIKWIDSKALRSKNEEPPPES